MFDKREAKRKASAGPASSNHHIQTRPPAMDESHELCCVVCQKSQMYPHTCRPHFPHFTWFHFFVLLLDVDK